MRLPTIQTVKAAEPTTLEIVWSSGRKMRADLSALIQRHRALAPLRRRSTFARAAVGEWGHSVRWTAAIDIGADSLYRLCQKQAEEAVTVTEFAAWRTKHGLSLAEAANALGVSPRVAASYDKGTKPLPKVVGLALKGYDAQQRKRAA